MSTDTLTLKDLEPRLRALLPADLYVSTWVSPNRDTLTQAHEHLRTLHRILFDYVPREVAEAQYEPGVIQYEWKEGTLMFTDLAGFTPMLEAFSVYGTAGASELLEILNGYFGRMIEIVGKSGGDLLEFTGDAVLVQFLGNEYQNHAQQAINTGLRMQRAMSEFDEVQTPRGALSLGMRIGLHSGKFLTAQIGTPRRMEQVLMGAAVRRTKLSEGAGRVGQVNLTPEAYEHVSDLFRTEEGEDGHILVVDDLSEDQLGDYELMAFTGKRMPSALILDRSVEGLTQAINDILARVEPLASYLPMPVLNLVVENANKRGLAPRFPNLTVMFINLIGLSEHIDDVDEDSIQAIVERFSGLFALINAAIESRGGVLKHVTYHLSGADMLVYFGTPNAHADDSVRAAAAASAIRDIVNQTETPYENGDPLAVKIGLSSGMVFAAEVGETRGRREWNILGDTVNTAARLMGVAETGQILMTESVYHDIWQHFEIEPLKRLTLKGQSRRIPTFSLLEPIDDD